MKKTGTTKSEWMPGFWIAFVLMLALAAEAATTNTYYVVPVNPSPASPYDTWGKAATDIQTAVNKASTDLVPGTTECVVLVSNGTYALTSQITITNGITLLSVNGRDTTFINGNYPTYSNRCIEIRNPPTMATVDGFSITNGYAFGEAPAYYGGGLYGHDGAVSIANCAILDNRATWTNGAGGSGGGMSFSSNTWLLVTNCFVARNKVRLSSATTGQAGGGLYIYRGYGLVHSCVISNNGVSGDNSNGGGLYVNAAALTNMVVSNCTFIANSARWGGGAYMFGGLLTHSLSVSHCCPRQGFKLMN